MTPREIIAKTAGADADAILDALDAAGFVVVPKEATEEMLPQDGVVIGQYVDDGTEDNIYVDRDEAILVYRAVVKELRRRPRRRDGIRLPGLYG